MWAQRNSTCFQNAEIHTVLRDTRLQPRERTGAGTAQPVRGTIQGSKDGEGSCETTPVQFLRFFFLMFFSNVYLFWGQRETEQERGRGRERGRHRIRNRLQALSHQPRTRRGARTPGPRDRDLAEVGCLTDCATQAPQDFK